MADSRDAYLSVSNRLLRTACRLCLNSPLNLTWVCELLQQIEENVNISAAGWIKLQMSSGSDFLVWNLARIISAEKLALSSFCHVSFSYCLTVCNYFFFLTLLSVLFSLSNLLPFYFCFLLSCILLFLLFFYSSHYATSLFLVLSFSPTGNFYSFVSMYSSLPLLVFSFFFIYLFLLVCLFISYFIFSPLFAVILYHSLFLFRSLLFSFLFFFLQLHILFRPVIKAVAESDY